MYKPEREWYFVKNEADISPKNAKFVNNPNDINNKQISKSEVEFVLTPIHQLAVKNIGLEVERTTDNFLTTTLELGRSNAERTMRCDQDKSSPLCSLIIKSEKIESDDCVKISARGDEFENNTNDINNKHILQSAEEFVPTHVYQLVVKDSGLEEEITADSFLITNFELDHSNVEKTMECVQDKSGPQCSLIIKNEKIESYDYGEISSKDDEFVNTNNVNNKQTSKSEEEFLLMPVNKLIVNPIGLEEERPADSVLTTTLKLDCSNVEKTMEYVQDNQGPQCGLIIIKKEQIESDDYAEIHNSLMLKVYESPKPLMCERCGFSTARKKYLVNHVKIHKTGKTYKCKECDYSPSNKSSLLIHMRSHTDKKQFNCDICEYTASEKGDLVMHIRSHIGYKPFKCDTCDYSASKKSSLLLHIRSHRSDKPFKCNICEYSAWQKKNLEVHTRRHTGVKPFICGMCEYSAARQSSLAMHIRRHTGEKTFKCGICDYSAVNRTNLVKHTRFHIGEKPFKCEICDYSAARKGRLVVHNRCHTGEKPFKCGICDYSTSIKSNLVTHIKCHMENQCFTEKSFNTLDFSGVINHFSMAHAITVLYSDMNTPVDI